MSEFKHFAARFATARAGVLELSIVLMCGISTVGSLVAGNPYIGVVVSSGSVMLNHYKTGDHATVFEADSIETGAATCRVQLADGRWAQLGIDSAARLFSDRVELEKGSVRLSNYSAAAGSLRIRPGENSIGTVAIHNGVVEVSALAGVVQVHNANGVSVTNVVVGRTLNVQPIGEPRIGTITAAEVRPGASQPPRSAVPSPKARIVPAVSGRIVATAVDPIGGSKAPVVAGVTAPGRTLATSISTSVGGVRISEVSGGSVGMKSTAYHALDDDDDDDDGHDKKCISPERNCGHHGHHGHHGHGDGGNGNGGGDNGHGDGGHNGNHD